MTNKVLYINVETGIEELRDQTAEEALQHAADAKAFADAKAKEDADKAAKAVDKAALLEKLGISEDEAKLLLG
jgi:hypothetical protein